MELTIELTETNLTINTTHALCYNLSPFNGTKHSNIHNHGNGRCFMFAVHRSVFYSSVITRVRLRMTLSLFGAFSRTIW